MCYICSLQDISITSLLTPKIWVKLEDSAPLASVMFIQQNVCCIIVFFVFFVMLSNNMLQDKHMFIISKRTHKRNSLKTVSAWLMLKQIVKISCCRLFCTLYIFSPVADCILYMRYVHMYFIPYLLAGQQHKYLLADLKVAVVKHISTVTIGKIIIGKYN